MEKKRAVKAFIVKDGKLLIVKRSKDSLYSDIWEVPGGRLEEGESIEEGLRREVREEVGLDVDILFPLNVHHFERKDNQEIHLMSFLCLAHVDDVKLSKEHGDFSWVALGKSKKKLHEIYDVDMDVIQKWFNEYEKILESVS